MSDEVISELNSFRRKMFALKFIGVNDENIGYGNMSIRLKENTFIVTGTMTGKIAELTNEHYTTVTEYDVAQNSLTAVGPIVASSESLTHAVIYECDSSVNAIIHIHDLELWEKVLNKIPTTGASTEYGTPAMAFEIIRMFRETDLATQKVLAMAGHEEGIIVFGKDLGEAEGRLMTLLKATI